MKQTQYYLSIAALVAVGTLLMGCNKLEEKEQPQENQSVTLATTLTLEGDDNTKALSEYGVKTFAAGDQIAVVYENTSSQTVKIVSPELETKDISNAGKSATISVTLTNPKANSQFKLIYPASMAKEDGSVNYEALNTQDGTLASLASLDLAVGEQTLNGTTLPASVTLDNPLAICKFVIMNLDGSNIFNSIITSLTVGDGTNTYVVNRSAAGSPIYVAVKPVTSSAEITITAESASATYTKSVTGKPLNASNLYPINVKCYTTYTALNGGEVLKVGDKLMVPDGSTWRINDTFNFVNDGGLPYEVVQKDLNGLTGEYYVLKHGTDNSYSQYFTASPRLLAVTTKSDGILVTKDDDLQYTFSVHEIVYSFSASSTKKVVFAPGNLQATYDGTNWSWDFAAQQYNYIGNGSGNTLVQKSTPFISGPGTVDLFYWIGESSTISNYPGTYGITVEWQDNSIGTVGVESLKYDWGTLTIGTYAPNTWRTLTRDEWDWIIGGRIDRNPGIDCRTASTVEGIANARYVKIKIKVTDTMDIFGLLLFPDEFTVPDGISFKNDFKAWNYNINCHNAPWSNTNTYDLSQWAALEAAGCVFLPAAGWREGNNPTVTAPLDANSNRVGVYWANGSYDVKYAYRACFAGDMVSCNYQLRQHGQSVRLVRDVVSQ